MRVEGGGGRGVTTYEVRNIHYIGVLPIAIFSGGAPVAQQVKRWPTG